MSQQALFPSHYTQRSIFDLPSFWEDSLKRWVTLWLQDLQSGVTPATPQSIRTFRDRFLRYTTYVQKQKQSESVSLEACLDIGMLYGRIISFPIESYSNRHCTFYAVHSLARFLIKLGQLDESYLAKLKPLKPKRVVPAKKTVLRDKDMIERFREAIQRSEYESDWSYLSVKTIMETLLQSGLRSSELAGLRLQDIDLENNRLTVYLGKGRKNRTLGITKTLKPFLEDYLIKRLEEPSLTDAFFLNGKKLPLRSVNIARMIQSISQRIRHPITAHGLRRTFATMNAEEGRPLHLIQRALGHADITTTQAYLMSDEQTVIDAMQSW